jgi:hypothetical protein
MPYVQKCCHSDRLGDGKLAPSFLLALFGLAPGSDSDTPRPWQTAYFDL